MHRLSFAGVIAGLLAAGCQRPASPLAPHLGANARRSVFEVIELGTLGGQSSAAVAVNDLGLVVGEQPHRVRSRARLSLVQRLDHGPGRPGRWGVA